MAEQSPPDSHSMRLAVELQRCLAQRLPIRRELIATFGIWTNVHRWALGDLFNLGVASVEEVARAAHSGAEIMKLTQRWPKGRDFPPRVFVTAQDVTRNRPLMVALPDLSPMVGFYPERGPICLSQPIGEQQIYLQSRPAAGFFVGGEPESELVLNYRRIRQINVGFNVGAKVLRYPVVQDHDLRRCLTWDCPLHGVLAVEKLCRTCAGDTIGQCPLRGIDGTLVDLVNQRNWVIMDQG